MPRLQSSPRSLESRSRSEPCSPRRRHNNKNKNDKKKNQHNNRPKWLSVAILSRKSQLPVWNTPWRRYLQSSPHLQGFRSRSILYNPRRRTLQSFWVSTLSRTLRFAGRYSHRRHTVQSSSKYSARLFFRSFCSDKIRSQTMWRDLLPRDRGLSGSSSIESLWNLHRSVHPWFSAIRSSPHSDLSRPTLPPRSLSWVHEP